MREFLSLEKNYDAERQTQAEKRDEKKKQKTGPKDGKPS